jgi:CubicO group peptidase (beta-lactamase class C family)
MNLNFLKCPNISPNTLKTSLLWICSILSYAATLVAADFDWKQSSFDEYVNSCMEQWEIPGVAIGIIKDGEVVLAKGYGLRNIDTGDPVNEETLFPLASVTKAFTATLVALSVDEGKLAWDDPISKHLQDFQLCDPYMTGEVTIRDVLSHRTGFVSGAYLWYQTDYTQDEIVYRLRFLQPSWSLRSRFSYSNILYSVMGTLEEKVSQDTWDNLIKEKIFKPLEMSSSHTTISDCVNNENIASSHLMHHDKLISTQWLSFGNCRSVISIFSNVVDLLKWVTFQLEEGKAGHREILRAGTIKEMHRPQTVLNDPAWLEYFPNSSIVTYGLGWVVHVHQGRTIVEHMGNTQGASSLVAFLPEENLGIVILTNRESLTFFPRAVFYHLLDQSSNQSSVDWNQFFFECWNRCRSNQKQEEEAFELERKRDTTPLLPLDQYSGEYENNLHGNICVKSCDGSLYLDSRTFQGKLSHWHFDTFKLLPNHVPSAFYESFYITFELAANGQVDSFIIKAIPGEEEIKFTKLNLEPGLHFTP